MNLDQLVLYGVNSARDVYTFSFSFHSIVIWNCCLCKERIRTVYWVSLNDNEYYDIIDEPNLSDDIQMLPSLEDKF